MNGWKNDKNFSDVFLPEIKSVVGRLFISAAPEAEDRDHATDLIVLRLDAVRVACRIRRKEYLSYNEDFTIRTVRPSGVKTELAKILSGWGTAMFYGFGDDETGRLLFWRVGDLSVFRLWFHQQTYQGKKPGIPKKNHDGSSDFLAFKWADLPKDFILAKFPEDAK